MASNKSKKNKPAESTDDGLEGLGDEGSADLPETAPAKPVPLLPYFQAYDAASAAVSTARDEAKALAKAHVEKALKARGDAVKAILEVSRKKVFKRNGVELTIVVRVDKATETEPETTTYYFKKSTDDVMEVV